MMAHSVKYGVDKFNREIDQWLLKMRPKLAGSLAKKIVGCSGVTFEVTQKGRMHNYLWTGIDLYLLDSERAFVKKLADVHKKIDREEIASLLAEGFGKKPREVKRMLTYFFASIKPEYLLSINGLVKIWKKALAGLPEKDQVDEKKTARLFEEIYGLFKNQWEGILHRVIEDVKLRMSPFL